MIKTCWLHSARFDLTAIIAPQIFIAAVLLLFPDQVHRLGELPVWLWALLIIGVDVSHVYSTVFRTYLDPRERARLPDLYKLFPAIAWVIGVVLYSINGLYFWRALAYLAVFHFVRQQYGFMMMYAARLGSGSTALDKAAIYAATCYPLLYWHCNERRFHWFLEHDFFAFNHPVLTPIGAVLYAAIMVAYLAGELRSWRRQRILNLPKNLLLLGTALTWWVGIITFNNDVAFTATNVIAHGVPYLALIWLYKHRESTLNSRPSPLFRYRGIPLYLAIMGAVAFLEEAIWDGVVWRDHAPLFSWIWLSATPSELVLSFIVPLLVLPQLLHYVFDGVIWRIHDGDPRWREVLFGGASR